MKKNLQSQIFSPKGFFNGSYFYIPFVSCFFILLLFSGISYSQVNLLQEWNKKYGGTGQDRLYTSLQLEDGGYLIGGSSSSGIGGDKSEVSRGNDDFWVIRIDKDGNKLWDKTLGGDQKEQLVKIIKTSDGNYLLAGNTNSSENGDVTGPNNSYTYYGAVSDYWIVKISGDGTKIWDRIIGDHGDNYLSTAIETSDGGFLLGGTYVFHQMSNTYYIVKTNISGDQEWGRNFKGGGYWSMSSGQAYLTSVVQTPDGGYLLGGSSSALAGFDRSEKNFCYGCEVTDENAMEAYDYWIVKISNNGTKEWDKAFGGFGNDNLVKIALSDDGGYIIAGSSNSGISGNKTLVPADAVGGGFMESHIWLVKISEVGKKVWERTYAYGEPEVHTHLLDFISTPSGYYMATNTSDSVFQTSLSLYFYDWSGNKIWKRDFDKNTKFGSLNLNSDQSLIFGVTTPSTGATKEDYQIFKIQPGIADIKNQVKLSINSAATQNKTVVDIGAELHNFDTPILKVEFFVDEVKQGEDLNAPFKLTLSTHKAGAHIVYAKVIDTQGRITLSNALPFTTSAQSAKFFRAINLNGPDLEIDNIIFEGSASAPDFSYQAKAFSNQSVPLSPSSDLARMNMIRSSLYATRTLPASFTFDNVSPGTYDVYVYVWEDNYSQTFSFWLEEEPVLENYQSGTKGKWAKLGPFRTTSTDGNLQLKVAGGDANLSGIEIWKVSDAEFYRAINLNGPAQKIENLTFESSNSAPGFSYQAKAFSNQSIALNPLVVNTKANMIRSSLYATQANPATFTFDNVPNGNYEVYIYAWEDNYTQTYSIHVNDSLALKDYKSGNKGNWDKLGPFKANVINGKIVIKAAGGDANISGIEIWRNRDYKFFQAININGPALKIDNLPYEAQDIEYDYYGNSPFRALSVYSNGNFTDNQSIPLIPETDVNKIKMIHSSTKNPSVLISFYALPPGDYDIYMYAWEDDTPSTYSVHFYDYINYETVLENYTTGTKGSWAKLGPFKHSVDSTSTYGYLMIDIQGEEANISGIELWKKSKTPLSPVSRKDNASSKEKLNLVKAYPNPVMSILDVELPEKYKGKILLTLVDAMGNAYLTNEKELKGENSFSLSLPLEKMSQGLYFLRIEYGKKTEVIRLQRD